MKSFDEVITAAPEDSIIELDGGTYFTNRTACGVIGGAVVKEGVKIFGNGSRILLQTEADNPVDTIYCLGGNHIEKVVVDGGGQAKHKRNGLCIEGPGPSVIRQCHVTNTGGSLELQEESFSIYARGGTVQMEDCVVSEVWGNYTTPFNIESGTGTRLTAVFPKATPENAFFAGLNYGDARNVKYQDCLILNCTSALYTDTGSSSDIEAFNCTFLNTTVAVDIRQGYKVQPQTLKNVLFRDNFVTLSPKSGQAVYIEQTSLLGVIDGLTIKENKIVGSQKYGANIRADNVVTNLLFYHNDFSSEVQWRNAGGKATNLTVVERVEKLWLTI